MTSGRRMALSLVLMCFVAGTPDGRPVGSTDWSDAGEHRRIRLSAPAASPQIDALSRQAVTSALSSLLLVLTVAAEEAEHRPAGQRGIEMSASATLRGTGGVEHKTTAAPSQND
jgi:hypothetical protein